MRMIALGLDAESPDLDSYASETIDDVVPDTVVRKFREDNGFVLATIWRGSVHEVVYQSPLRFFWSRWARNRRLLAFYGEGRKWSEDWPVDFGKSLVRADGKVRSIYSETHDYMTFVTSDYDTHRSDIRWKDAVT